MQDVAPAEAHCLDALDEVLEIARVRLVAADVLGGEYGVEGDVQLAIAGCERGPIDIRQDHQSVVLFQVGERCGRIGKRRPLSDAFTEGPGVVLGNGNRELLGNPLLNGGEQLRVAHGRRGRLLV